MSRIALALAFMCCHPVVAAPLDACETSKQIATGTLCVVKPSKTDPQIKDADPSNKGFGDHVVGIPSQGSNGLWVHLTGTSGKPYLPNARRYLNEVWINELMGQGYTVLDLAYDNEVAINDTCSSETGKATNNCAGAARLEILTGIDASPVREVNVANSVRHRVAALIDYLADNGFALPDGSHPFTDWSTIRVSGHSQGGGHAYYLAKYSGVKFACFLGSPYDVSDNVPAPPAPAKNIADWYLDTSANKTPVRQMGAFLTTADDSYGAFTSAYDIIGLTKGKEWLEADKRRYTDDTGKAVSGHAASVQDPSLAPLRAKACFR